MQTITVDADLVAVLSTDRRQARHAVTFEGETLGRFVELGRDPRDVTRLTHTRGEVQTLYKTDRDVLLVHVETFSIWEGDALTETLYRLTDDAHLQPGGRFEGLGRALGLARPLTLRESGE